MHSLVRAGRLVLPLTLAVPFWDARPISAAPQSPPDPPPVVAQTTGVTASRVAVDLPDDMGTIRIVGELPTAGLVPGQYTLRVVVNDGQAMASRAADVTLAP